MNALAHLEVCHYCSATFEPRRKWSKFCSQECHNAYHQTKDVLTSMVIHDRMAAMPEDEFRDLLRIVCRKRYPDARRRRLHVRF